MKWLWALLLTPMATAAASAFVCGRPGIPPRVQAQWASSQSALGGLPLSVVVVKSRQSPANLRAWYRGHWQRQGAHPWSYAVPGWKVIARLRNGCLETVQTQAAGSGTLAYVGLSAPRDFRRVDRARVHFPYPGDSRLLSVVTSHDQSQKGSTLLLASRRSVSGMDRYYRRTLVHQGWVLEMNRKLPDGDVALIFQRGAEEADVALSHDADGSEAVINVVHH